jgi:hypothetical protein
MFIRTTHTVRKADFPRRATRDYVVLTSRRRIDATEFISVRLRASGLSGYALFREIDDGPASNSHGSVPIPFKLSRTRRTRFGNAPHIGMARRKPKPHIARYGKQRRSSTTSIRVDLGIHPDALPFAKIDLDQSNSGGRHRLQPPGIAGEASQLSSPASPAAGNMHLRKTRPTFSIVYACLR